MAFLSRHRVSLVLLVLAVVVVGLVGYRIKQQQAAAVPRRQIEVVVRVAKPLRKPRTTFAMFEKADETTTTTPMEVP